MADKLFTSPSSGGLKAITINGAIQVESAEDAKKRQERRAKRKSRWDNSGGGGSGASSSKAAKSAEASDASLVGGFKALTHLGSGGGGQSVRDNPAHWREVQASQLPATLDVSKMDEKAQQIYLLKMQIQEACLKLNKPDLGIPANPRDRSPSPEPIYNNKGVRINTRLDRTKNKLISMRNAAITRLKDLDPTYQPPSVFKYKNAELEDKVTIPAEDYPHINFVGLLLGPRGKQLEEIKAETNTQISIRGKGSLRAGMTGIMKDGRRCEALEEPLHALITGTKAEDVKKASKIIQDLMEMEIYNPDSEKAIAMKAKHMHDLAVINGTLRDIDLKCLNCGKMGHQTWQCMNGSSYTSAVICHACGGVGHLTKDCNQRRPGQVFNKIKKNSNPEVIDKEYEAFLSDMGEKVTKKGKNSEFDNKLPSISGGIGGNNLFGGVKPPLMLTNGSAAPGAASAHMRSLSNPQVAGGAFITSSTSIFGGKMTRMTSGFKSAGEIEMEKEKKKREFANRPVPLEWQVERYEKQMNKQQEEYYKSLERSCQEAKKAKQMQAAAAATSSSWAASLGAPPPPPPPPPPGSSSFSSSSSVTGLPDLNSNPWESLKKS